MKSTRQQLKKIPGVTALYRHEETGIYYGIAKVRQKIQTHSFDTADRKLAEGKLKDWREQHSKVKGDVTLAEQFETFIEAKQGRKKNTLNRFNWVKNRMGKEFALWNTSITKIKPSELSKFFGTLTNLKPGAYNQFVVVVSQVFDMAIADSLLMVNPVKQIIKVYKKDSRKPPEIPTLEEFNEIIKLIRDKKFKKAEYYSSADFLEFQGLFAVGEAEASTVDWSDVKWNDGYMLIQRMKTSEYFRVPIYGFAEPFLRAIWEKQGKPVKGKIFRIRRAIGGLRNICREKGIKYFSPRNFRQMGIVRLLKLGVPPKLVAKAQGHADESLIIKVYSEVISSNDEEYHRKLITEKTKLVA